MRRIESEFSFGDIDVLYISDESRTGLIIVPKGMPPAVTEERRTAVTKRPARAIDPLVQVKLVGDAYPGAFGNGVTMHNSETTLGLRFVNQEVSDSVPGQTEVTTELRGQRLTAIHSLTCHGVYDVLESKVTITNTSDETVGLEMLASFSLGMLSPLDREYKPHKLLVHRLRSRWAQESRLETCLAEDLMLSPSSWAAVDVHSERFGQTGNKTNRTFSPFVAIEDVENKVLWGAQLVIDGSWQMEVYNYDETLSISGGLPDYDFGHWMKNLSPGQSFTSPSAHITVCRGDLDMLCNRLVSLQEKPLASVPESEKELPVIFNDWCSSWGDPTQEKIFRQLHAVQDKPIRYYVLDAGWFKDKEHEWFEMVGDWEPSREKYPEGLRKVTDRIREAGMIPGIWFEIETCGLLSKAFQLKDHLLTKFGKQIVSNDRKYWDFRDPWTSEYLTEKVTNLLEDNNFGYLKIDSNECVGIGCDGAESLGEGLRQNLDCFMDFIHGMKKRLPNLVIENCSSGGQRVTPKMSAIFPMFSCSDSFECSSAPIVAANMHRISLPRQSQIWCVVRDSDNAKRLVSKLSTGFLGRMCLSGEVASLSKEQLAIVDSALEFYRRAIGVIGSGITRRHGPMVRNYAIPSGWQAVVREGKRSDEVMVVLHTFDTDTPRSIEVPLPEYRYRFNWAFKPDFTSVEVSGTTLTVSDLEENEGLVIMLKRV